MAMAIESKIMDIESEIIPIQSDISVVNISP